MRSVILKRLVRLRNMKPCTVALTAYLITSNHLRSE